jgi:hypothetical protein
LGVCEVTSSESADARRSAAPVFVLREKRVDLLAHRCIDRARRDGADAVEALSPGTTRAAALSPGTAISLKSWRILPL